MIKILFLGHLKETAGTAERYANLPADVSNISDLINWVSQGHDNLREALSRPSTRIIVNQSILVDDNLPDEISEIAFMPPLSGG